MTFLQPLGKKYGMNGPFNRNPLYLAKEAQQMAAKADPTDRKVFQKVALVSICVMAAASVSQIMLQLWKDLRRKEQHERRGRAR